MSLLSKTAERMLRRKAGRFRQLADQNWNWIKKNHHRCGHSNALGDEGWMESHRRSGEALAYEASARSLESIIKKLTKED